MIALGLLRDALKLADDDQSQDDYLVELEAAAVAYVQRVTGRYFGPPIQRTEYLVGEGGAEVWLSEVPIASGDPPTVVVSVDANGQAVDTADYTVRERRLRHTLAWGYASYPSDLVVTYTAGYPLTGYVSDGYEDEPIADIAAPADIRQAVIHLVTHWNGQRTPVSDAVQGVDVPHMLADIMAKNRRVGV